jgi:hypothetical protein
MSSLSDCSHYIDVAVLSQTLSAVNLRDCREHNVYLNPIDISGNDFRCLFYANGENFALNPANQTDFATLALLSLTGKDRAINDGSFNLVSTIFDNLEDDLNVTRDMFTPCTRIALSNSLANIQTLYDVCGGVPVCSMSWSAIEQLIKNILRTGKPLTPAPGADATIIVNLVISVVFSTPTTGTFPTTVKMIYRSEFLISDITDATEAANEVGVPN